METHLKIAFILFAIGASLIVLGSVLSQIPVTNESGTSKPFGSFVIPFFVVGLAFLIISVQFFIKKSDAEADSAARETPEQAINGTTE